jgi:hypothetical protein
MGGGCGFQQIEPLPQQFENEDEDENDNEEMKTRAMEEAPVGSDEGPGIGNADPEGGDVSREV